MDLNELFVTLAIIIVVALLLLLIYKVGLSSKSFDEAIEEQKLVHITFTEKSKQDAKKDKKGKKLLHSKKKLNDRTELLTEDSISDIANTDHEAFDSMDFKEIGGVAKTAAGKRRK